MIKTLRITSIIAAIAATILLIIPAVYGVRSDPKIEEFLKSPGAVEKFTATKGQNAAPKNTESPLVQASLTYKNIINPPPPPPPKVVPGAQPQGPAVSAPPVPVAAKFDIAATSYCAGHPEQSLVLIDEAGKGLHWVKQGATIGRVTIDTIKDGAIVVRDGQRTSEMEVKVKEAWRSLLKNPPPATKSGTVSTSPASSVSSAAATPTNIQGAENPTQPTPAAVTRPGAPPITGRRSIRPGAPGRITSPESTPAQQMPATAQPSPAPEIAQPTPPVAQTTPAAKITPPPEEKPAPEESQAIKEKQAKIDKLLSEAGSDEKKMEKVYSELEELGKMRENEAAKDANK
jgi:hypothetical protein